MANQAGLHDCSGQAYSKLQSAWQTTKGVGQVNSSINRALQTGASRSEGNAQDTEHAPQFKLFFSEFF